MRFPCLIVLLSLSQLGSAQRTIDLTGAEPDLSGIGIVVDTVVLGFNADAPIGTLHAAFSGDDKQLRSKGPVDRDLTTMLRERAVPDSTTWHVALKVNVLKLEDRLIGKKEVAFCSVHIEFLERTDSGWVRCYDHGATLNSENTGTDHWYITTLFAKCVEEVFRGAWNAHEQGALSRVRTVLKRDPTPSIALDLPITHAVKSERGIYPTFQDFRYNRIDTSANMAGFEVAYSDGVPVKGHFDRSAPPRVRDAWACSDGDRLYVNLGTAYVPLKWDGKDFATSIPLGDVSMGISPAMGMFGLIGASAIMLSRSTEIKETPVRLDLLSGRLELLLERTSDGGSSRARIYFVHSKFSAQDSSACLFVFGGREACMLPGQHYEYTPLRRADALPVEVRSTTGSSVNVYLDTKDMLDQVFLIKSRRDGTLTVDQVRTVMANDMINELQPENAVHTAP